ncbi:MAG: porin [Rhodospirillaceae bacterium]|nr:porin [Rhodospirillaceae bacterium]|tara:strand:+ start:38 stop:1252 length:1215 start_codon:yes stop_codon:yes gene_type:complete
MKNKGSNVIFSAATIGLGLCVASAQVFAEPPTAEEMWDKIQELEMKVETTGEMIEESGSGGHGHGGGDLLWGGYAEVHYNAGDKQQIDVHRWVLFTEYEFNDKLRVIGEFELEHALAGDGKPGEVELEQAFIEYNNAPTNQLYAGVVLVPVGMLNETHEPPTFFGVERDRVHSQIIPTTWWEAGVGSKGELSEGLGYDFFFHSGLEVPTTGSSAFAIRSGRQKVAEAVANRPAATFRLRYAGMPGLNLTAGIQYQDDLTQGQAEPNTDTDFDTSAYLYNATLDYRNGPVGLKAMYAAWDMDGGTTGVGAASFGRDEQWGYFIEPSYRFAVPGAGGDGELGIFARYYALDTKAGDSTGSEEDGITVGFNYWIHPDVVLKADYDEVSIEGSNSDDDRLNLGIGWQF